MPNQTNLFSCSNLAGQLPQKRYKKQLNTAAPLNLSSEKQNCPWDSKNLNPAGTLWVSSGSVTGEACSVCSPGSWRQSWALVPGRGEAAALTALTERMSAAGRPFRMWNRTSSGRFKNVRTRGRFIILRFEGKEKHLEHLQWTTGKEKHRTPQLVIEQHKEKRYYIVLHMYIDVQAPLLAAQDTANTLTREI